MEIKSSFKERLISKIKTFIYILLSPCHPHGSKWHIPPLLVRLSAVGFPTLECKQNSKPRFTFFSARTANPECSVFRMPRTMWHTPPFVAAINPIPYYYDEVCKRRIFISKHPTTVKNAHQIITFHPKLLHNSNKSRTFAATESATLPVRSANQGGSFAFIPMVITMKILSKAGPSPVPMS